MIADPELEGWRGQWQTPAVVPHDLQVRVERQTRFLRILWIGEIAITAVFGGGSLAWALAAPRPDVIVLAAGVWIFLTIAWSFAMTNRRGIWEPHAATTAAFLDLSILRRQRTLQALTFSVVFYAAILTFDLAWIYHGRPGSAGAGLWTFLTSASVFAVWVVTAGLALVAAWHRRRVRAELRSLIGLRRQIEDVSDQA